ncbi:hypothetical protein KIPB_014617, partial [Kipferlia bialata]
KRCLALGCTDALQWSKRRNYQVASTEHRFQSKQVGTRDSFETRMPGIVHVDMMQAIQLDFKLRSYSLNAVSARFLGAQKEDVHYSMITPMWREGPDSRRKLAIYCLKDALLPLQLMEKLVVLYNQVEMARVTGIPMRYILSQGQTVKVLSQLYAKARDT